jgi:ribonuclease D
VADLRESGRLEWALDECEQVRTRSRTLRAPEDAWLRIKEARHLRGATAGIARAVAAWRERRAAEIDQPVRFILPDLGVVGIAQRAPKSRDQLRAIRGLDERHVRGQLGDELLEAVAYGRENPAERPRSDAVVELERQLRPAVTLVSAWVSQLARDLRIDTSLLATRADIEALLGGIEDGRLSVGWRADLVGEPIRRLVRGDAALAFDGNGGLLLEERSHKRIR